MFDMKDSPESVYDFLSSMLSEKGRSQKTVFQYYHDLRTYGRYLEVSHSGADEHRIGEIAFGSVPDSLMTGARHQRFSSVPQLGFAKQAIRRKQKAFGAQVVLQIPRS